MPYARHIHTHSHTQTLCIRDVPSTCVRVCVFACSCIMYSVQMSNDLFSMQKCHALDLFCFLCFVLFLLLYVRALGMSPLFFLNSKTETASRLILRLIPREVEPQTTQNRLKPTVMDAPRFDIISRDTPLNTSSRKLISRFWYVDIYIRYTDTFGPFSGGTLPLLAAAI
jgi:hypothetical protein